MKGPIVLLLGLCVVLATAEDVDQEKAAKFLKCVACSAPGSDLRKEYETCATMKPERLQKVMKSCCDECMPGVTEEEDRYTKACSDDGLIEKILECAKAKIPKSEITPEEKDQFKEYKACAMKLSMEKCH